MCPFDVRSKFCYISIPRCMRLILGRLLFHTEPGYENVRLHHTDLPSVFVVWYRVRDAIVKLPTCSALN